MTHTTIDHYMKLQGNVVLISGASSGMGTALAKNFAKEHCKLVLCARREDKLKELADILKKETDCIYKTCDVKNKSDIDEAVRFAYKSFGRIDVAILAAGILVPNPIEVFDSSIIKDSMETNFLGDVYFIESLLPIMKKQKSGVIAAISTLPDKRGVPGWGAYGASKAAVSWMMESLRSEAKQKYNIDIITIKPGSVKTPMIEGFYRPGAISAEQAADYITRGIKQGKKIIQFPLSQVLMIRMQDQFPVVVYDKIPIELQKGKGYPTAKEKELRE